MQISFDSHAEYNIELQDWHLMLPIALKFGTFKN